MRALRREDVWLNSVSLRDVDPKIINIRVIEEQAQQEITYGRAAGRDGRMVLGRTGVSKKIGVEFMIREIFDLAARSAIVDAVNEWAGTGGVLRCSTRPDRQITLITTGYAAAGDLRDYNAPLRIDFETAAVPCWENVLAAKYEATAASGSTTLALSGNAPTWAEVDVTAGTSGLTSLSVTFGDSTIALSGFSIASGKKLRLWHDDNGILRITSDASPYKMAQYRSAASADDLIAGPGNAAAAFTANTSCGITIQARGRYR